METRTPAIRWSVAAVFTPALIIAVATCTDRSAPTEPTLGDPSFEISDAVHFDGNQDFFFLPPLVGDPSQHPDFDPGAFDADLLPEVEICLFSGNACANVQPDGFPLTYTMTAGVGTEVVRVNETDEHYAVEWHTHLFTLGDDETYRILVSAAGITLAMPTWM